MKTINSLIFNFTFCFLNYNEPCYKERSRIYCRRQNDMQAGKQRKSKSTEPSDKPKRPMTAYFRFTNEKRAEVKAKNPGISCFLVINNRNEGN